MVHLESLALSCLAPASRPAMAAMLQAILETLGMVDSNVELQLVGDQAMARYNADFLGLEGPTNVLAFPADDPGENLGQIILDVDMLRRESLLYGQEPVEHLARLLGHAALHLIGHEHGEVMEALTDAAMAAALEKWASLESGA